jgi:hypothetical protein
MTARSYRDRGQLFGTDGTVSWIEPDLFSSPVDIGAAELLTASHDSIIVTDETAQNPDTGRE